MKVGIWFGQTKAWAEAGVAHRTPGVGVGLLFTEISEQDLDQIRRYLETLSPFARIPFRAQARRRENSSTRTEFQIVDCRLQISKQAARFSICNLKSEIYIPLSFFDFSSTPRASFSLCASSFFATEASPSAIICAARIPALVAPGFPIATVATGMPAGICTVASSESIPLQRS